MKNFRLLLLGVIFLGHYSGFQMRATRCGTGAWFALTRFGGRAARAPSKKRSHSIANRYNCDIRERSRG